jgi:hypothetical protein
MGIFWLTFFMDANKGRRGFTAVFPTGKFSSLKFAESKGAIVRVGQDFTSFSLGWQRTWLKIK